jgi:hypothetical protein
MYVVGEGLAKVYGRRGSCRRPEGVCTVHIRSDNAGDNGVYMLNELIWDEILHNRNRQWKRTLSAFRPVIKLLITSKKFAGV